MELFNIFLLILFGAVALGLPVMFTVLLVHALRGPRRRYFVAAFAICGLLAYPFVLIRLLWGLG